MCPVGEYVPDPTESVRSAKDLPKPEITQKDCDTRLLPCPKCQIESPRHCIQSRKVHDIGNSFTQRPREIHIIYSQHHCASCQLYFCADLSSLVAPYAKYTKRVVELAVRLVVEDGLPYGEASWNLWRDHRVWVPRGTVQNWVEESGKKRRMCR